MKKIIFLIIGIIIAGFLIFFIPEISKWSNARMSKGEIQREAMTDAEKSEENMDEGNGDDGVSDEGNADAGNTATGGAIKLPSDVKSAFEKLKSSENAEGVAQIDMNEEQYFLQKQSGVSYAKPMTFTYDSKVTGTKRKAKLLLPADYSEQKEYNLLLILHGLNGSMNTWINKKADIMVQNAMHFEHLPQMIVVFADSNLNESQDLDGMDFIEAVKYFDRTEEDVMNNLLPAVEKQYHIKQDRDSRAIAGHSLGGRNALYIAYKHPEQFAYVGAFGPAKIVKTDDNQAFKGLMDSFKEPAEAPFKLLFVTYGREDMLVRKSVKDLRAALERDGTKYIYYETEGEHEDAVWQPSLYNFLRLIFQ